MARGRDFKLVTEIIQNGDDFTWIQYYPKNHIVNNKFIIGKESEMETVGGKKFKVQLFKKHCTPLTIIFHSLLKITLNVFNLRLSFIHAISSQTLKS